ncbi:MAG TPA: response regulator [Salegentibacter sp.]|nr:response regulator [Salegentibacter sp.]
MTKTIPIEILIAEDDQLITTLQKKQLGKLVNTPIKTFWNGKELMNYLDASLKEVESLLILLDINMPVMDGWEVLEKINHLYAQKEIFVVMLTSSVNPADRKRAFTFPQVISFNDKFLEPDDFYTLFRHKSLNEIIELKKVLT